MTRYFSSNFNFQDNFQPGLAMFPINNSLYKEHQVKPTENVFSVVGEGFPSVLQSSSSGEHLHGFQISGNPNNRVNSVDTCLGSLATLLQGLRERKGLASKSKL